jgi:uncharacterized repeat protein (TIGR01451 family)
MSMCVQRTCLFASVALVCLVSALPVAGSDLTLPSGGRVTVELITSDAAFRNTLAIASPAVGVAITGCKLEPATNLTGVPILSEKLSQHGCRVELDADPGNAGIQPFAANAVLSFNFCAQTDADPECEYIWSSNSASNSDAKDHVATTTIAPGVFRLSWEDTPDLGDNDFNDLIAVVRVTNDTDGDGLWDDWEQTGVDTNGDGVVDLDLPGEGADPMHKDIFVEIDWMDCSVSGSDCAAGDTHNHQPKAAAIAAVVQAFADAPVTNPDGVDGITLHVDVSNSIAHKNFLRIPNACFTGTAGTEFDAVKADPANFGPDSPRRFAYHYNLWTHRQTSGDSGSSGCAELPGNDFQVSLGAWNLGSGDLDGDGLADAMVGTIMQQAGTFMHEFGHNLRLQHGGGDWTNFKPNYLSVMNYAFQVGGLPPNDPDGAGPLTARIDYSTALLPTLVETSLNEPAGISDGTDNTTFNCPTGAGAAGVGNGPIDWNCDADGGVDLSVSSDVNGDALVPCVTAGANSTLDTTPSGDDVKFGSGSSTQIREGANRQCNTTATGDDVQFRPLGPLAGFFDWTSIKYDFQNSTDFEDGFHTLQSEKLSELSFDVYLQTVAPDPGIALGASPDPVLTGSNLTYVVKLTNHRPTAAMNVVLAEALPPETGFVSCASDAGGICGGSGASRSVSFPTLAGGDTATVTLVALVSCPVPDGTVITSSATVSADTPDSNPSNNGATASVVASNPPPKIGTVSVDRPVLWPPNHEMVNVAVDYIVTDNCGPVACTLAVSSNEPVNGQGDGNTSTDWQVIDAHHVRVRAERSGKGDGRIYGIGITCTDSSNASSAAHATVVVPKSQGH